VNLDEISFADSPIADQALLVDLPAELRSLLTRCNGFIAFRGGLHVRAACIEPGWHSLRDAWRGPRAYWRFYRSLSSDDIPFAQDCLGDQFFLRDSKVHRLHAELDDTDDLGWTLDEFFDAVAVDPDEVLALEPLDKFLADGGCLTPGLLLQAYPPFCMSESSAGNVSLRAVPADELRGYLADLAARIRDVSDGGQVSMKVT